MTLRDIALVNLRRREGRGAFVVAQWLAGESTVVAPVSLSGACAKTLAAPGRPLGIC